MLKGLEASEVRRSQFNDDARLDAEFFKKQYIAEAAIISHHEVGPLGELAFVTDGQHGYHEIDEDSPIHMLTAQSARGWFADTMGADTIAQWVDDNNKRSSLQDRDLILSTRGTVGLCAIVAPDVLPANIDQDVARIHGRSKRVMPEYLLAYLNCGYGQDWMTRNQSGMVQQGLSLAKVRDMPIPLLSRSIQQRIINVIEAAFRQLVLARDFYAQAEKLLLSELGLKDWQPEEPLSYEATSSTAFAAERLDAEHFRPKYSEILAHFELAGIDTVSIEEICPTPVNGVEVREYCEDGVPYLRVGDIKLLDVDPGSVVRIDARRSEDVIEKVRLRPGDVLLSRSGSLGVAGVVTEQWQDSVISSHLIRIRARRADFDPYYLALFLQALPGRMQIEKWSNGGVQPEINQPSLKRILVPHLQPEAQKSIRQAVEGSRAARNESEALLEKAKRAVEIAIEKGEEAAGEYLDGKAYVQSSALPAMTAQHRYFSLDALKQYLVKQKLTYEPETVNAYVSRMKREGEIFSAGRGWYSSIEEPFEIDPEPVSRLVSEIKQRFPLLDFTCWSTGQLNPYLHHMLGKFVPFIHVDRDAMPSVFDALQELGYHAYLNPTRREAAKSFVITGKTVVIRPAVAKAPANGHYARIEKLLVDLHVELESFALIDPDEFREAAQAVISTHRIDLAKLQTYASQRKVDWRAMFLDPAAIIASDEQP